MLGKLIKYEFKATGRFMLLAYGLLIVLSVIMAIGTYMNVDDMLAIIVADSRLGSMVLGVFIFMIVAMFIIMNVVVISGMFFYAIKRFKDNLLGDEGYLMHTLPVKTSQHINAKCIVSVIWTIISAIVVGFSFLLFLTGVSKTNAFIDLLHLLKYIEWENYSEVIEGFIFLGEGVIMMVVALTSIYLRIYASMAVGFSYNTHRTAKSIGAFIIISILTSVFEVIVSSPFDVFKIGGNNMLGIPHMLFIMGIFVSLASAVGYYIIAHYFMKNKLNLQ